MKIIGATVGTTIPKPNYEQTDPTKGDYIKGDISAVIQTDTTLTQEGQVADSKAVGDTIVNLQSNINELSTDVAYINVEDNETITTEIESVKDTLKTYIDTELQSAKDSGEFDGVDGKTAYQYAQDGGYTGTEEAFADDINPDNILAKATPQKGVDYFDGTNYVLTDTDMQEIAEMVENVTFYERPIFVSRVEDMTDTSKAYVLESTGTIWEYQESKIAQEITEQIVGTTDNPYELGRLSSGSANGLSGYVTTPYIDITKYSTPFQLHLEGATFYKPSDTYLRFSQFNTSKEHIVTNASTNDAIISFFDNVTLSGDETTGACVVSFTPPITNKSDVEIGYVRFSAIGIEADANVYIVYDGEVGGYSWVDTGIEYGSSGSTNEDTVDITEFNLVNPSVKSFMNLEDYPDDDYSYSNVTTYAGSDYFRKDLPFPIMLNWEKDSNAIEYTVSINTISGVLTTGMQTYYEKDNKCIIYNLCPNTTYYYKVYGLYPDSSKKLLKDGSFTTNGNSTRMLNIDGIQNVRDIGGYVGADSKTVKYGLIYRGSAMDETVKDNLCISDKGKHEMLVRIGIRTDLDLRGANTVSESALKDDVDFYTPQYSYLNYADAITDELHKGYFKDMLEYIVAQLTTSKPVYIHCSGGCDRTGTLVFLLLGVLGVSESDLSKEYELSSFSSIGKKTRTRNSTTYDYSGMVASIKTYSGDTITDKFVAFANDCGVTTDTITSFRSLMLE